MNLVLNSSKAVGRYTKPYNIGSHDNKLTSLGFILRQVATNSLKCFDQFPVSSGGLDSGIKKRTLIGCISPWGGSLSANSIAVIPRDQISACNGQHSTWCCIL